MVELNWGRGGWKAEGFLVGGEGCWGVERKGAGLVS